MVPQGGQIMSAWEQALVCGIYTVSPLHVSTGQAEGAIDLPVAKEPHTGFPVIPASSLKGVARDAFEGNELSRNHVNRLFGPTVDETTGKAGKATGEAGKATDAQASTTALSAGALVFTEARLVAYAVRSLNRPFLYVTSRLVLERLARDLRAANVDIGPLSLPATGASVLVADKPLAKTTLVLEDLVYTSDIAESADVEKIGESLAALLPASEDETRRRLKKSLVVIPDVDFAMLVRRLPVRARIKLNDKKTTSGNGGNLWYEEQVPADCLFVSLVGARRGKSKELQTFCTHGSRLAVTQIGGNETVGEGICFWTLAPQAATSVKRVP
jgi:CRISPR-associated protein Cmr4